ncbi:MAG: beta,4-xylanase, family [Fibrobacteres bacterium]|nr:beta,4-xylanase, family [Fibrobacterota bacterium]
MRTPTHVISTGGILSLSFFLTAAAGNASAAQSGAAIASDIPATYKGLPYGGAPRSIPGRVDFEDYDLGGVNVAWKSDDKAGQGVAPGSTAANRADDGEKDHPAFYITNSNPGEVDKLPDGSLYPSAENPKSIYIGAAHATDYANVTVNVAKAGTYWLSAHFASQPNEIKLHVSFNGVNKSGPVTLAGTNDYHAWKFYRNFAKVELEAGVQVMQFMLDSYHLNWDYISFASDTNGVVGLGGNVMSSGRALIASLEPNGINGWDLLRFSLPQAGPVRIVLVNARGRENALLLDRSMAAGMYSFPVSLAPMGTGIRFLRITQKGSSFSLGVPTSP